MFWRGPVRGPHKKAQNPSLLLLFQPKQVCRPLSPRRLRLLLQHPSRVSTRGRKLSLRRKAPWKLRPKHHQKLPLRDRAHRTASEDTSALPFHCLLGLKGRPQPSGTSSSWLFPWGSPSSRRGKVLPCCSISSWFRRSSQHRERSTRSEEHTSELQSRLHLVCRLLLEKKKKRYEVSILHTQYTARTRIIYH